MAYNPFNMGNILSNFSSNPLTSDEVFTLQTFNYSFNKSTPPRVMKNMNMINSSYNINPGSVDLKNPEVEKTLQSTTDFYNKFKFIQSAKNNGVKLNDIPGVYAGSPYSPEPFLDQKFGAEQFVLQCSSKVYSYGQKIPITQNGPMQNIVNFSRNMNQIDEVYKKASPEDKKMLVKILNDHNVHVNAVPKNILKSEEFVDEYFKDQPADVKKALMDGFNSNDMTKSNDNLMSKVFTQNDSMNQYLQTAMKRQYTPNDAMGQAQDIIAVRAYGVKKLNDNGITDVNVSSNSYKEKMDFTQDGGIVENNGSYYGRSNDINLTVNSNSVEEKLVTVTHETQHAVQNKAMKEADIEKVPTLPVQAKDKILREELGSEYYTENYYRNSKEYDAEVTAKVEVEKLKTEGEKKTLYDKIKEKVLNMASKDKEILDKMPPGSEYTQSQMRMVDGELVYIDDAFKKVMDEEVKKNVENGTFDKFKEKIEKETPIIVHEYNITEDGVNKKTPKQLVQDLDNAATPKDEKIYKGLVQSSMDATQTKDYKKNIEETKKLAEDPSVPVDIKHEIKEDAKKAEEKNKSVPMDGKTPEVKAEETKSVEV